jgi:flagellar motor switch protein FliN
MTDDAANLPAESAKFVEVWAQGLAQVLGQVTGSSFPCVMLTQPPAELPASAEGDLWIICACAGGLRGEMSLRLPPVSAARLARILIGEPVAPEAPAEPTVSPEHVSAEQISAEPISGEQGEAATELFRQVAGLVASELKPQWGEVQLRPEIAGGTPSWPSSSTSWLRAGETADNTAWAEVHLSAALGAALRAEKAAAPSPSSDAPPPSAPSGNDSQVKLNLLMDVELALTLRFGSRSLPLSEILDLTPGAVIELDRQVHDPVDMLLDGRVVARGEVVVMEGNYGLRVTEVGPAAT